MHQRHQPAAVARRRPRARDGGARGARRGTLAHLPAAPRRIAGARRPWRRRRPVSRVDRLDGDDARRCQRAAAPGGGGAGPNRPAFHARRDRRDRTDRRIRARVPPGAHRRQEPHERSRTRHGWRTRHASAAARPRHRRDRDGRGPHHRGGAAGAELLEPAAHRSRLQPDGPHRLRGQPAGAVVQRLGQDHRVVCGAARSDPRRGPDAARPPERGDCRRRLLP